MAIEDEQPGGGTAEPSVSWREYVDGRFDTIEYELRQGNRGLHYRLDEIQAQNTREHETVGEAFRFAANQHQELDNRVDQLERVRDHHAGQWSVLKKAAVVAGVLAGPIAGAIAGLYLAG